jgi:hypothetical protein
MTPGAAASKVAARHIVRPATPAWVGVIRSTLSIDLPRRDDQAMATVTNVHNFDRRVGDGQSSAHGPTQRIGGTRTFSNQVTGRSARRAQPGGRIAKPRS